MNCPAGAGPADLDDRRALDLAGFRMLDHHDRIGAARQHAAGRDQGGEARRHRQPRLDTGRQHLEVQLQSLGRLLAGIGHIAGAQRKAVDIRAIEAGNVDLGDDGLRQHPVQRQRQRKPSPPSGRSARWR